MRETSINGKYFFKIILNSYANDIAGVDGGYLLIGVKAENGILFFCQSVLRINYLMIFN